MNVRPSSGKFPSFLYFFKRKSSLRPPRNKSFQPVLYSVFISIWSWKWQVKTARYPEIKQITFLLTTLIQSQGLHNCLYLSLLSTSSWWVPWIFSIYLRPLTEKLKSEMPYLGLVLQSLQKYLYPTYFYSAVQWNFHHPQSTIHFCNLLSYLCLWGCDKFKRNKLYVILQHTQGKLLYFKMTTFILISSGLNNFVS